jgi:hypothetical protein
MISEYIKVKSLIFDGSEQDVLKLSFTPDTIVETGGAIKFNDFANNTFEGLLNAIGKDDFDAVLKTGGFTPDNGFLKLYKGSDGLRLYFSKKGNTVVVFAYGEFQPTRYKLYLEGIWKIN